MLIVINITEMQMTVILVEQLFCVTMCDVLNGTKCNAYSFIITFVTFTKLILKLKKINIGKIF